MSPTCRLISLNIEGEKHLQRFADFIRHAHADVVMFQEVPQHLLEKISSLIRMRLVRFDAMSYASHPYKGRNAANSVWGMACFVDHELEVHSDDAEYYRRECVWGHPDIRRLIGQADRLVQSIAIGEGKDKVHISQTHFTWTGDGLPDVRQREDIVLLLQKLSKFSEFVLLGDFNVPRGRNDIWDIVSAIYKDNIPPHVMTTLDERLHRVGHLPRAVDMCFTSPALEIDTIEIVSGLSDHQAVVAELILP